MNQNGRIRYYGTKPRDYLTDVLGRLGSRFIDHASRSHKPFFLELATFAPHEPYVPAPRYRHDFRGLQAPRPPDFDVLPTHAPTWLQGHQPFDRTQIKKINHAFRLRVQDVQSVDDMIAKIETTLAAHHELRHTDIVFSSDNGLHTGEHRLLPGKLTAFTTDIRVPLVIAGPGIPAGARIEGITENIDLASTFEALAGTRSRNDGDSLLPLLHGRTPPGWQNAVLIEHRGPALDSNRPRRPELRQRQPDLLRGAAHQEVPVRRLRQRAARVLRPADRPVRAVQRLRLAELKRADPPAGPAVAARALPRPGVM